MTGIKRTVASNAAIVLAGQWIRFAVQLIGLVILSRLLGPSDVGLVAMVASVVAVAAIIGDLGLSLAAIQAKDLTAAQKSTLFWLNSALGMSISICIAGCASLISDFYNSPETLTITYWLSSIFAIQGITVQFRVELNRAERFRSLALIDALGPLIGLIIAIIIAVFNGSYMALVAQQISSALIILLFMAISSRWIPGLPRRGTQVGRLVSFGVFTFLAQLLTAVSTNLGTILVGHSAQSSATGTYSRAYQIAYMPSSQIAAPLTRVVMPRLASRASDPVSFGSAARDIQRALVYGVGAPLSLLGGAAASIIPLVLGNQWYAAVPLTRILAIAAFLSLASYIFYWLLLATAQTKLLFLIELGARGTMIMLMIGISQFGPEWVAGATVFGGFLLLMSNLIFAVPRLQITRRTLSGVTLRPMLLYACAAIGAGITDRTVFNLVDNHFGALCVACLAWISILGLGLINKDIRADFKELITVGRSIVGR